VTLGNIVGGFIFTGLAIYWTFRPAADRAAVPPIAATAPAE
jgi:formate/nitrite transporter FocA (FNT family)